jgi:polar amino acid transport system substrate-binding protein
VELADNLARRLSVPVSIVGFDGAVQILESALAGGWDLAFLAIEEARCRQLDFTAPFVVLEGTYLVRDDSPYRNVLDVDRDGVRIAVGRGGFYDLRLTRTLRHAQLVRAPTNRDAAELFLRDRLDALPGLRQPLVALAQANPGLHVIEGRFSRVEQAMAVPKGHSAGLRYLNNFVEQVKSCDWFTAAMQPHFRLRPRRRTVGVVAVSGSPRNGQQHRQGSTRRQSRPRPACGPHSANPARLRPWMKRARPAPGGCEAALQSTSLSTTRRSARIGYMLRTRSRFAAACARRPSRPSIAAIQSQVHLRFGSAEPAFRKCS